MKEKIFEEKLKICQNNITPPWTMENLENVLAALKNKKSHDQFGFSNEIFKLENIGNDLKRAILVLMN